MKTFILALAMLLGLVASAGAHGGRVVFVPDGFGGARAVVVHDQFVPRGGFTYGVRGFHHVGPRFVHPGFRGNVTPFNQNGGVNRIGRRR